MAGTKAGGKAAAATNTAKDPLFYHKIGAMGGKKGRTGGWYANRVLASHYGRLGGTLSRRGRKLSPAERARKRREFERTYEHLLRVNKTAEKQRQAMLQSA